MVVFSLNSWDPIYFIKVNKNRGSNQELRNRYGHVVFSYEIYLKGFVCKKARYKNVNKNACYKKFTLVSGDVFIT